MKRFFFPTIVCVLVACSACRKKFDIVPLSPYVKDNKFDSIVQQSKYYLIEGYADNIDQFEKIRDFAFRNIDTDYKAFDSYAMVFYRESSETNRRYKETPENIIEWHGDDIVYMFVWKKGGYRYYFKYKNGEIINAPKIKIRDID